MADAPQYKKGSGPDALPQGEATILNEQSAAIPDNPAPAAPPADQVPAADATVPPEPSAAVEPNPLPPVPTGQTVAPAAEAPFRPQNDRQKFLTTPDAPGQPGFAPSIPTGIDSWAFMIARAAELPDANESIKLLNRMIAAHLGPM